MQFFLPATATETCQRGFQQKWDIERVFVAVSVITFHEFPRTFNFIYGGKLVTNRRVFKQRNVGQKNKNKDLEHTYHIGICLM